MKKGNLILIFILIIVIAFGIFAYSRYNKTAKEKATTEAKTATETSKTLSIYTYGGVEKVGYMNYEDAVDSLIKFYNEANGEALAAIMDFAGEAVYDHKGLVNFDENIYQLVTDAQNYKDEYYNNSFIIMCASFQNHETGFIEAINNYKVKMELQELSELKPVEESKYLYEATAKIKIKDNIEKQNYNSNTKITFITYDKGKSFYILKVQEAQQENETEENKTE